MRSLILMAVLWALVPLAWAGSVYELHVDGLACPYCSYGIEKQLRRTEGVKSVAVDLKRGVVLVTAAEGTRFSEDQMRGIVKSAGFSLRGMTVRDTP